MVIIISEQDNEFLNDMIFEDDTLLHGCQFFVIVSVLLIIWIIATSVFDADLAPWRWV